MWNDSAPPRAPDSLPQDLVLSCRLLYGTWPIHMWHDSFICDTTLRLHDHLAASLSRVVPVGPHMWHVSFICDMTHSYVTWLIHMWHDSATPQAPAATYPAASLSRVVPVGCHMWHVSFMCDMTHSCGTWTHPYVTWLIHMWHNSFIRDITQSYWHDSFIRDMTHSYVT